MVASVNTATGVPADSAGYKQEMLDCFHCDTSVPAKDALICDIEGTRQAMCCSGCLAAVQFIKELNLENFYRYRDKCEPEGSLRQNPSHLTAAALGPALENIDSDTRRLSLLIPDIRCAACIWLIEKVLGQATGVKSLSTSFATRRLQVELDTDTDPESIVQQIEKLGYEVRPDLPDAAHEAFQSKRRSMLTRLGVAGIGMMQVMMYALASYLAGPGGIEPAYESLLRWASLGLTTPVVFYSAMPFHRAAWQAIRNRSLIMDVPVSMAILAAWFLSTWATFTGGEEVYFDTACMFTFFLLIGRYVELLSRHRFQQSQDMLHRLLPLAVIRIDKDHSQGGADESIAFDAIRIGDHLRVRPGEVIPADAIVVSGISDVSEAAFTGEPLPLNKTPGSRVLAGAENLDGELIVEVRAEPEQFLIRRIARLYDQASQYRPRWSRLADRTARGFVAAVLVLAAGAGLYWYAAGADNYMVISMTVLVVACPCALSLATPVAYSVAVTAMRRCGIIIKNGAFLERAAETSAVVFDKTGTLTESSLGLDQVMLLDSGLDEQDCLALATALERHSEHPIARAFNSDTALTADQARVVPGQGVEGRIGDQTWRIGQPGFVQHNAAEAALAAPDDNGLWVMLGSDRPVAWFQLRDQARRDIGAMIANIRQGGLSTAIFTGDHSGSARRISEAFGVDQVITHMMPDQKISAIRELVDRGHKVMMIGDGVNDAGAMAAADTSLAVSPRDVSVQNSADATLLGDALTQLPQLLKFARKSRRIIRQNVTWAITYNFTVIPFAIAGMVPPWLAALGMSLSSILVIANAGRLHRMEVD